jgi:hypothetical protein
VRKQLEKTSKVWNQWKTASKVFHLHKDVTLGIHPQADW